MTERENVFESGVISSPRARISKRSHYIESYAFSTYLIIVVEHSFRNGSRERTRHAYEIIEIIIRSVCELYAWFVFVSSDISPESWPCRATTTDQKQLTRTKKFISEIRVSKLLHKNRENKIIQIMFRNKFKIYTNVCWRKR